MVTENAFLYTAGHSYSHLLIMTTFLTASEAGLQVLVLSRARYTSVSEGPVRVSTPYCFLMSEDSILPLPLLPRAVCLISLLLTDFPLPSRPASWVEPWQADHSGPATCPTGLSDILTRPVCGNAGCSPHAPLSALPFLSSFLHLAQVGTGTD